MPHEIMIELEAAGKHYGPRHSARAPALQDVTLAIPRGSTLAVVGPNGAGKTTLFGLVLGFLRPTTGAVRVGGMPARSWARAHGVGYLPERFAPPREWRVRDTLRALARVENLPVDTADAALEQWDLGAYGDSEIGSLSHGLLQRVGLAQALLAPRELVVLDEPTEGLDPLWRVRLREAVNGLTARDCTVLIASHDLAEVERMCARAVLLRDGRVREVLETAAPRSASAWRITLAAPHAAFDTAFPAALPADMEHTWDVTTADAGELNARMAAAIAGGARIIAISAVHEPLEARVQRALRDEETA